MRKITNAAASHVMGNPFRSRSFSSALPCLMLYFGDRAPIMTNINVELHKGSFFDKYDMYEEDGKIYVKVGDNMIDTGFTLDIIAPLNYDIKYEE